jgi:2-oxoglutarate ferredoxin oxidoreductase subunit beta
MSNLRQLTGYMKKALQTQMKGTGFSFVEALSTCPTNWGTNAEKTWHFLEHSMQDYYRIGEFKVPDEKKEE